MGRYGKGTNFHIVIIGRAPHKVQRGGGGGGGVRETEGEGMTGGDKGDEG